jgi:phosphoribosyl-ATP pyrophosphohydrolase
MKSAIAKEVIITHCAETNKDGFNLIKVLEEISEFQEVATKIETKHPSNPSKPKKEQLIKEFGDLVYRGLVYLKEKFPEMSIPQLIEEIDARMEKKLSNLEEWKRDNLYKQGL